MKRIFSIIGLVMLLSGTALVGGCASPCDDLDELCSQCPDELTTAACELVVAVDDADSCDAVLSSYEESCQ